MVSERYISATFLESFIPFYLIISPLFDNSFKYRKSDLVLKVTQLSGVRHVLLNRGYFYPHSSDLKCHPAALTVLGAGLIRTAKSDSTAEAIIALYA